MGADTLFLYFLFAFVTVVTEAQNLTCPIEVLNTADTYYLQSWNGWCFKFVLTWVKPYSDANRHCLLRGGTLALPKTAELNNFINDKLRNLYAHYSDVWIGLHDKKREGKFVWEDHTEMEWSNFAQGNGPGRSWFFSRVVEDCVSLDPKDEGRWYDYQCGSNPTLSSVTFSDSEKPFICQYKYNGDNTGVPKGDLDTVVDDLLNQKKASSGDSSTGVDDLPTQSDTNNGDSAVQGCPTFDYKRPWWKVLLPNEWK